MSSSFLELVKYSITVEFEVERDYETVEGKLENSSEWIKFLELNRHRRLHYWSPNDKIRRITIKKEGKKHVI